MQRSRRVLLPANWGSFSVIQLKRQALLKPETWSQNIGAVSRAWNKVKKILFWSVMTLLESFELWRWRFSLAWLLPSNISRDWCEKLYQYLGSTVGNPHIFFIIMVPGNTYIHNIFIIHSFVIDLTLVPLIVLLVNETEKPNGNAENNILQPQINVIFLCVLVTCVKRP